MTSRTSVAIQRGAPGESGPGRTVWFEVAYGDRRATRRMAKENPELSRRGRFLVVNGTVEDRTHSYDAYVVTTATGKALVIPHSRVSLITTEVSK